MKGLRAWHHFKRTLQDHGVKVSSAGVSPTPHTAEGAAWPGGDFLSRGEQGNSISMLTEERSPPVTVCRCYSVGSGRAQLCVKALKKKERRQCSTGVQRRQGHRSCQQIMERVNVLAHTVVVWKITFQSGLTVTRWKWAETAISLPFLLGWSGCHWHRQPEKIAAGPLFMQV